MTTRSLPASHVAHLAARWFATPFPVPADLLPDRMQGLGWTPVEALGTGTLWATGHDLSDPEAVTNCPDGFLSTVDAKVTDMVRRPSQADRTTLEDAFITDVVETAGRLGPTRLRVAPREQLVAAWRNPTRDEVQLTLRPIVVLSVLGSSAAAELQEAEPGNVMAPDAERASSRDHPAGKSWNAGSPSPSPPPSPGSARSSATPATRSCSSSSGSSTTSPASPCSSRDPHATTPATTSGPPSRRMAS